MADVAMNALGVEVEHRLNRSIMSGLHGMWSVGALLGAAVGTVAAHAGLSAQVHHAVVAVVLTRARRRGVSVRAGPASRATDEEPPPRFALPPKSALLIGAVGFCAVFAEGASLDWSAVYLRDILDSSAGVAAGATTGFALTMAIARLTGDAVVDRFGAVRTVRCEWRDRHGRRRTGRRRPERGRRDGRVRADRCRHRGRRTARLRGRRRGAAPTPARRSRVSPPSRTPPVWSRRRSSAASPRPAT